uniref:Uncharacterized protein n=1 Tax=Pipistrellus kuhlii TaxID=59472 RepID=A0A7J7UTT9_PIPKU|nr:hypothetical protein mPipKuh1_008705 [Pipistrellus kuhlii]
MTLGVLGACTHLALVWGAGESVVTRDGGGGTSKCHFESIFSLGLFHFSREKALPCFCLGVLFVWGLGLLFYCPGRLVLAPSCMFPALGSRVSANPFFQAHASSLTSLHGALPRPKSAGLCRTWGPLSLSVTPSHSLQALVLLKASPLLLLHRSHPLPHPPPPHSYLLTSLIC